MQKESEQSGPRQDKAYIISEKQITKMIVKLPTQSVMTIPIKILRFNATFVLISHQALLVNL